MKKKWQTGCLRLYQTIDSLVLEMQLDSKDPMIIKVDQ